MLETCIFSIITKYYNKNKSLPPNGKMLVAKNIIKKGDLLDYMLDVHETQIKISYSYYEDSRNETKYICSSFYLT